MLKKKLFILLFLIFSVVPINTYAETNNTGFIPSNIWYSKDPFEEGDKVKIYTVVFNGDTREFSGTVSFFDDTIFLGKKSFVVTAKSTKDMSIDWTVSVGIHKIFAKIENARFATSGGNFVDVFLNDNKTDVSETTIRKKILPVATKTTETVDSIKNIQNIIKDQTPSVISKPIVAGLNLLEDTRGGLATTTDNTKASVAAELKALDTPTTTTKKGSTTVAPKTSSILKPWKYVELFFLTIFSFILSNKLVFYLSLAIVAYFLLRYIWNLVF